MGFADRMMRAENCALHEAETALGGYGCIVIAAACHFCPVNA
jgi:hypothetical protein